MTKIIYITRICTIIDFHYLPGYLKIYLICFKFKVNSISMFETMHALGVHFLKSLHWGTLKLCMSIKSVLYHQIYRSSEYDMFYSRALITMLLVVFSSKILPSTWQQLQLPPSN